MTEENRFAKKLRELRKKAGFTQRGLAGCIDVDFTYISKLENGQLPPPSEPVVARLAEALRDDRDELMRLSGRVPADIAGILKDRARQEFGSKLKELRKKAGLTQQELAERAGIDATYLSKIENCVMPPPARDIIIRLAKVLRKNKHELLTIAGKNPVNIARIREKLNASIARRSSMPRISLTRSSLYRAVLVVFLVITFATSLWLASPAPVKAVDIDVINGGYATIGQAYSFSFTVTVQDADLLPIQSVDLRIFKASGTGIYAVLFTDLPLPSAPGSTLSRVYSGTGGTATISGTAGPAWTRGQNNRYGYGYGYQTGDWGTLDFGYGYGYGYYSGGDYTGATYISYDVVWVSPSSWPEDYYRIQAIVYGTSGDDAKAFTNDAVAQFLLAAPAPGGGGPGGGTTGGTPVIVDSEHRFVEDVRIESGDNQLVLTAPRGARGETATGQGLTRIYVTEMTDPPALPAESNRLALVYDLGPDGARFPDGITLTMKYDPAAIVGGTLVMAYWDGSAWVDLEGPFRIDPVAHTISTTIYHFTPFTVKENISPAAFAAGDLTISPAEVEIGEAATIVVTIANTGDLSGTYSVVLKVDGVDAATATVTVAGHDSTEVSFTLSMDAAGTYSIGIDGLSGVLVVKALPATPTPTLTPTLTPTPSPTPTPTLTPTPTSTPTPLPTLAEPEEGTSWWRIVIIIAAVAFVIAIILVVMYRRRRA